MTAGGDMGQYGDRVATVFFKSEEGIWFGNAVNDNKNYWEAFKDELKVEEWNEVVISQEFQGLKLMYIVSNSSFQMYSKLRTYED